MKLLVSIKWLVCCIILFENSIVFGQNEKLYKAAFEYIAKENHGSKLIVSDTIVHLQIINFAEEISSIWKTKMPATMMLLDSIDWTDGRYKQQFNELKKFKKNGTTPAKIIFFSETHFNNMFIAEIMNKNENGNSSYSSQSQFKPATIYLFLFKRNKIIKVFQAEFQYE